MNICHVKRLPERTHCRCLNVLHVLYSNSLLSDGLKALGLSVDWTEEICHKYPYAMFSPISFKWSYLGESGGLAVCPWPLETTIYRLALAGTYRYFDTFQLCSQRAAVHLILFLQFILTFSEKIAYDDFTICFSYQVLQLL